MKKTIALLLFIVTTLAQAKTYQGIDRNGRECSLIIHSLQVNQTETPERRDMYSGETFSTTKKNASVTIKYVKDGWLWYSAKEIGPFDIESRLHTWGGNTPQFSLTSIEGGTYQDNEDVRHAVVYFDYTNDYKTPSSFVLYKHGLNGLITRCEDLK